MRGISQWLTAEAKGAAPHLLLKQTGPSQTPHTLRFILANYHFPSQVLGYILSGAVFVEHPGWRLASVGAQGLASSLQ